VSFKEYLIEARYADNRADFYKKLKKETRQWIDIPSDFKVVSKDPYTLQYVGWVIDNEDDINEIYQTLLEEFRAHAKYHDHPYLGTSDSEDRKWEIMLDEFNEAEVYERLPAYRRLKSKRDWNQGIFDDAIDQMKFSVAHDY